MKCLFIILGVVVCSSLLVRGEGVDFEKPFFDFQTPSFLGEEERERVKGLFWRGDVNGEGEEKVARDRMLNKDPDCYRNFTEVVTAKGYPCEFYEVETDDGYILGMYHIPYGVKGNTQNRPPVLVQHGLTDWSFTWILNYPNQSLPYILADAGYDVWLGNNRGTTMSRKHKTLSVHSKEFWEFSFDQFIEHDLPAMVNFVMDQTNTNQISYVGHSQGTLQMFGALSEAQNMVRKHINVFIALAPVAYIEYLESHAIRILANKHIPDALYLFGLYQFPGPETPCMESLFASLCYVEPDLCTNIVQILCGHNRGAFNHSRMDVMGSHEPGDTSVVNMNHWAQALRTGTFQKYNFGPVYNEKFYGQKTPPIYNISEIPDSVPIALFSGNHDKLADPKDVQNLAAQLPGANPVYWSVIDEYAHLDFVWAIDAAVKIYPDVLKQLAKYN